MWPIICVQWFVPIIVSCPVMVNYHFSVQGPTMVGSGADKDKRAVGFVDATTCNPESKK